MAPPLAKKGRAAAEKADTRSNTAEPCKLCPSSGCLMLSNQDSEDPTMVTPRLAHIIEFLKCMVALRTEEGCSHNFFGGFLHWGKSVSKHLRVNSFLPKRFGYVRQESRSEVSPVSGKQAIGAHVRLLWGERPASQTAARGRATGWQTLAFLRRWLLRG